jgi:hemolysin activation/secretion protein
MGSTVLKPQAWDAIVRPLTGKTVTIGDLKATADHLTQLYSSRQDGRDMLQ